MYELEVVDSMAEELEEDQAQMPVEEEQQIFGR